VKDHGDDKQWENAHRYDVPIDVRAIHPAVPLTLGSLIADMLRKKPSERPDTNEVVSRLSASDVPDHPRAKMLDRLAERARQKVGELERARLAQEEAVAQAASRREAQTASRLVLCSRLDDLVRALNSRIGGTGIQIGGYGSQEPASTAIKQYTLPTTDRVDIQFFPRVEPPEELAGTLGGCTLLGGAWIGATTVKRFRSFNLALLRYPDDDEYGSWKIFTMTLKPGLETSNYPDKFGLPLDGTPFGHPNSDVFYTALRQFDDIGDLAVRPKLLGGQSVEAEFELLLEALFSR
jgi:hypothetical protein